MKTVELVIGGMSCGHCVMHLKKELNKIADLNIIDVQVGSAKIEYDEEKVNFETINAAVDEAGYTLLEEK